MNRSIVVFAGDAPLVDVSSVPPHDYAIAADSGLRTANRLGVKIDKAIGDFDSTTPAELNEARHNGVNINRYPARKDATDLELALDAALALGAAEVTVIAAAGGRFDHSLANIALLAHDRYADMKLSAVVDATCVYVVRSTVAMQGTVGDFVSLIPANGPVSGVTTDGLEYPLRNETLHSSSTRGVSNEFSARRANVSVESGVLLVVQPESEREEGQPVAGRPSSQD